MKKKKDQLKKRYDEAHAESKKRLTTFRAANDEYKAFRDEGRDVDALLESSGTIRL